MEAFFSPFAGVTAQGEFTSSRNKSRLFVAERAQSFNRHYRPLCSETLTFCPAVVLHLEQAVLTTLTSFPFCLCFGGRGVALVADRSGSPPPCHCLVSRAPPPLSTEPGVAPAPPSVTQTLPTLPSPGHRICSHNFVIVRIGPSFLEPTCLVGIPRNAETPRTASHSARLRS